MLSFLQLALLLVTTLYANGDLDSWQYINRGKDGRSIAVNNKALYVVKTDNNLDILEKDIGFEYFWLNIINVDVNDDLGLWMISINHDIFFRSGITASNLKGTSWLYQAGKLVSIATGRRGLVFASSSDRLVFTRGGITSGLPQGSSWPSVFGSGVDYVSCGQRVCFCITVYNGLWTTELLPNVDSPGMTLDWKLIYTNVKDVSAYGDKTLWKIDTNGDTWEAVDVLDSNFIKVNWERRGYQTTKFKDIAVTDKKAYALATDGRIYVRTGCPIFDFEDNDLKLWQQTGTAFADQPVLSETLFGAQTGKVGERLIDTYSKRNNATMPQNQSMIIGDGPHGTLISPFFQIRDSVLHFSIGGGTFPNNYVALVVDNSEAKTSSGNSRHIPVVSGLVRLARFLWDVTELIGKCARIKLIDSSSAGFGFTLFDDLRASPPCFKGMQVIWTHKGHTGEGSVGNPVVESINLKGFYTSKLRVLTITIEFPSLDGIPLVYLETVNITWTHCNTKVNLTEQRIPSASNRPTKLIAKISELLSDATVEIVARVNDHAGLAIPSNNNKMWPVSVSVSLADEYAKTLKKLFTVQRLGTESAKLDIRSGIRRNNRIHTVGDTIVILVAITHSKATSTQRAYNVVVRLNIPRYMSFVKVVGLNSSLGDSAFASSSSSEHTVVIQKLLLGDKRILKFEVRIDGDSKWKRHAKKTIDGDALLDATYCLSKDCKYTNGTSRSPIWLLKNKEHRFSFSYPKQPSVSEYVFTVIVDRSGSLTFFCAPYQSMQRKERSNCYFINATRNTLIPLGPMLSNISYYDSAKKEIYGAYNSKAHMKLYGERFQDQHMLTGEQWNAIVASSNSFDKPVNGIGSGTKDSKNIVTIAGGSGYQFSVNSLGASSKLSEIVGWIEKLHWLCCN